MKAYVVVIWIGRYAISPLSEPRNRGVAGIEEGLKPRPRVTNVTSEVIPLGSIGQGAQCVKNGPRNRKEVCGHVHMRETRATILINSAD